MSLTDSWLSVYLINNCLQGLLTYGDVKKQAWTLSPSLFIEL